MVERNLVIKITVGKDDPERCGQALSVAATAVASGVDVSLWLAGEAAWFSLPGRADDVSPAHSRPLGGLLAAVLAGAPGARAARGGARRGHTRGDGPARGRGDRGGGGGGARGGGGAGAGNAHADLHPHHPR